MNKYTELKARAEAMIGFDDIPLAPDVILALIAENEAMAELKDHMVSLRETNGFDSWAAVLVEIDRLKAENDALRKNSDRYQWLRDKSESVHQFYLSTPIWFTGVKFRKENVDSTIDAAMGSGEQA